MYSQQNNKVWMSSEQISKILRGDSEDENIKTLSSYNEWILSTGQRMYSWQDKQIFELISDIDYIINNNVEQYLIQSITITSDDKNIKVLDGQQRLTTFYLLKYAFSIKKYYDFKSKKEVLNNFDEDFEDDDLEKISNEKSQFLESMIEFLEDNHEGEKARSLFDSYKLALDEDSKLQDIFYEHTLKEVEQSFQTYIREVRIKLDVFLNTHSDIKDHFNGTKSINTTNRIVKKLIKQERDISYDLNDTNFNKYKNEIYKDINQIINSNELKNNYILNIINTMSIFITWIIDKDENEVNNIIEIVNNNIVIGVTYQPSSRLNEEVKSFTNINTRGLHLDIMSQFKPWYFEQVLSYTQDNINIDNLFKNINNKFIELFDKYDYKFKNILKTNNNLDEMMTYSLVDTINFVLIFTRTSLKMFKNVDGEEVETIEKNRLPSFDYNSTWLDFTNKLLIKEPTENGEVPTNFVQFILDDIANTLMKFDDVKNEKSEIIPDFINIFELMLSGRKNYYDILEKETSDIDNNSNISYAEKEKGKYKTKFELRSMPFISLICSRHYKWLLHDDNYDLELNDIYKNLFLFLCTNSLFSVYHGNWGNKTNSMTSFFISTSTSVTTDGKLDFEIKDFMYKYFTDRNFFRERVENVFKNIISKTKYNNNLKNSTNFDKNVTKSLIRVIYLYLEYSTENKYNNYDLKKVQKRFKTLK